MALVACLGVLVRCVQRLARIWNSYIGDHIIDVDSLAFPYFSLSSRHSIAFLGVFKSLSKKESFSTLHFLISPSRVTKRCRRGHLVANGRFLD